MCKHNKSGGGVNPVAVQNFTKQAVPHKKEKIVIGRLPFIGKCRNGCCLLSLLLPLSFFFLSFQGMCASSGNREPQYGGVLKIKSIGSVLTPGEPAEIASPPGHAYATPAVESLLSPDGKGTSGPRLAVGRDDALVYFFLPSEKGMDPASSLGAFFVDGLLPLKGAFRSDKFGAAVLKAGSGPDTRKRSALYGELTGMFTEGYAIAVPICVDYSIAASVPSVRDMRLFSIRPTRWIPQDVRLQRRYSKK